jgi:hypothetical protein
VGTSLVGTPVDLAGLRGRSVLVEFLASWDGASRQLQKTLVAFRAGYPESSHITVIGVLFSDTPSAAAGAFRVGGFGCGGWGAVGDRYVPVHRR